MTNESGEIYTYEFEQTFKTNSEGHNLSPFDGLNFAIRVAAIAKGI